MVASDVKRAGLVYNRPEPSPNQYITVSIELRDNCEPSLRNRTI